MAARRAVRAGRLASSARGVAMWISPSQPCCWAASACGRNSGSTDRAPPPKSPAASMPCAARIAVAWRSPEKWRQRQVRDWLRLRKRSRGGFACARKRPSAQRIRHLYDVVVDDNSVTETRQSRLMGVGDTLHRCARALLTPARGRFTQQPSRPAGQPLTRLRGASRCPDRRSIMSITVSRAALAAAITLSLGLAGCASPGQYAPTTYAPGLLSWIA